MNGFLNYEKFREKIANLEDPYWLRTAESRWGYMEKVIAELIQIAPKTALELGTNKISLMNFSDSMGLELNDIDPENRCNQTFVLDAGQTPWPISNRQYDVFVALQVMEHLSPRQSEVFREIRRIARYAILSFPYKWNNPEDPIHYNIGDEVIRKWTNHYPPYKILFSGEANKRIILCFHFEQEVITHVIRYPVEVRQVSLLQTSRFIPPGRKERINEYFDNIYLVNLEKRQDRLIRMLQMLGRLNIAVDIVQAIDGQTEPHLSEFKRYQELPLGADRDTLRELILNRKAMISPGGWGHLKTVRAIMKDMQRKGYQRILILEDDTVFIHDFHRKFSEMTRGLDGIPWKILMLGASQHYWNVPDDLRYPDEKVREFDPSVPVYHPVKTLGTFAIAFDHSIVNDYIVLLESMQCNADRALHSLFSRYEQSCFVAIPNLIISDVSDSNITARGKKDQQPFQVKQKWNMSLYDFPFRQDLVTIIVPMYNASKTIERSVRSLMRQTYGAIEIIVVDDGSTDDCGKIVKSLSEEDSRIIYINCSTNRGCFAARNVGVRRAQGKYITFHDADDIALTRRIEHQLLPLVSRRARFTIAKIIRSIKDIRESDFNDDESLLRFVQSGESTSDNPLEPMRIIMPLGLATTLFDRSLFEQYGLFWEERFAGDAEFLERILYHECGLMFPFQEQTAYQYLSGQKSIPGLFEYIGQILYICLPRNEQNLSRQYRQEGDERKKFRERYRRRLSGQDDYSYPTLQK